MPVTLPDARPRIHRVPPPPRRVRARNMAARVLVAAVTIVVAINVWTGFPLVALWIGSQLAGGDPFSMRGLVFALLALVLLTVLAYRALSWLSLRYDELTGKPPLPREPAPWLMSLRGGRSAETRRRRETNAVERIIVLTVVAALLAFEVWFFFLAHFSLPK